MARRHPIVSIALVTFVILFLYSTTRKYRSSDTLSRIQQYTPEADPQGVPRIIDEHGEHASHNGAGASSDVFEHEEILHDDKSAHADSGEHSRPDSEVASERQSHNSGSDSTNEHASSSSVENHENSKNGESSSHKNDQSSSHRNDNEGSHKNEQVSGHSSAGDKSADHVKDGSGSTHDSTGHADAEHATSEGTHSGLVDTDDTELADTGGDDTAHASGWSVEGKPEEKTGGTGTDGELSLEELAAGLPIMEKMPNQTARAEVGNAGWKLLHTTLAQYPVEPSAEDRQTLSVFLQFFSRVYPCRECAENFQKLLATYPPQLSSRKTAVMWGCEAHNKVNKRLGKDIFDCAYIFDMYDCGCDEEEDTAEAQDRREDRFIVQQLGAANSTA